MNIGIYYNLLKSNPQSQIHDPSNDQTSFSSAANFNNSSKSNSGKMNIGIYYKLKRNAELENNDSQEVVMVGASDYYCTNPFTALKIAYNLSKENKNYRYGLQQLPQDIVNTKTPIANYGEFVDYSSDKIKFHQDDFNLDVIDVSSK